MDFIGSPVYNRQGVYKGKITDKYVSETDDEAVFLVNDDWEVAISMTEYRLWSNNPVINHGHILLK